jgi:hypothetical protein
VSDAAAVRVVADILADYLPTELKNRSEEEGLPEQSVSVIATGRHIQAQLAGQVGIWVEDSETRQQFLGKDSWEYRDIRIVVEATVNVLDLTKLDAVRSVWADSIRHVIHRRYRVKSDARFFAIHRDEVLDSASSSRSQAGIRGVLGNVLSTIKPPPLLDQVRIRFTFGQRVSVLTDIE